MVQNEVQILASLHHPHIIDYRCSFTIPDKKLLCIVMGYAEGGTLADVISAHAQRQEPIPESLALHWLRQLASALSYLHQTRVLHRDLKSHNVRARTQLCSSPSRASEPRGCESQRDAWPLSRLSCVPLSSARRCS
eukprot:7087014-Prymnesium_polylepis.1